MDNSEESRHSYDNIIQATGEYFSCSQSCVTSPLDHLPWTSTVKDSVFFVERRDSLTSNLKMSPLDQRSEQAWGTVYCFDRYIAIYCSLKRILQYMRYVWGEYCDIAIYCIPRLQYIVQYIVAIIYSMVRSIVRSCRILNLCF